jgi:putative phosphoesterase
MTRVGVMTDIHANLPALEATLAEIEKLDVDAIYCGGDLVGCGPHPNQVCELIRERAIPTIYGNYDYAIGRDLEDCGCAYIDKHDREIGQLSVDWTLAHANRRSKEFMGELPFDLRFELAGKRVRLVHGSPRKVNGTCFEDKPARTFERIAALADCDLLVFGHTHKPWIHEYGRVLFVNCGSVGKPKDGDARAAFSVLEARGDDVVASIERPTTRSLSHVRCVRSAYRTSSPTSSSPRRNTRSRAPGKRDTSAIGRHKCQVLRTRRPTGLDQSSLSPR